MSRKKKDEKGAGRETTNKETSQKRYEVIIRVGEPFEDITPRSRKSLRDLLMGATTVVSGITALLLGAGKLLHSVEGLWRLIKHVLEKLSG